MASLTKKPLSRYWIACYTDASGKQRQRSTKSTVRKDAQRIAEEFEAAYRTALTEGQARRVIADIYEEVNGEKLPSSSIKSYFEQWVARKEVETKKGTFARYKGTAKKFIEFMGDRANKDLVFISSKDVVGFRDSVARALTQSSANTDLKILRVALQQAWKDGLIQQNPAAQVDTLRITEERTSRRPFTVAEMQRLLKAADAEWKGIILTGFYTGQRLGDLVRLRWSQVNLEAGEIQFSTRKTGRRVLIPIVAPLLAHLRKIRGGKTGDGALFPEAMTDVEKSEGDSRRLSGQFYHILVASGLAQKRSKSNTGKGHAAGRKTNPLSFHSLRHTATSMLKNAGVSEAVAMDIIGHDSREISLNYTKIESSAKRTALESLPTL